MGEKKEEDLYRNFSRKDFQGLCKKYGLPANKSNSEMATSLILYLEKKNISSKNVWEVSGSDPYLSLWSELQPGARKDSAGNKRPDLREMSPQNGFGQFRKHQNPDQNDLRSCKGAASSDKASEDMGHLTQRLKGINGGSGDGENAFSSVLSSTTEASVPSFTYDVSCKDGIQLYVDLNLNTSDWIESMKSRVDICHNNPNRKSSSERKGSSPVESQNDAQLGDVSCRNTVRADVSLQADKIGGESFRNTTNNLEGLGEELKVLTSISAAELQNGGSECFTRKENEGGTNSDANLVTQIRTYKPSSPPDLISKNSKLPGAPFTGIEASLNVHSLQRHENTSSSSRVATFLVSPDQQRNSRTLEFGPFNRFQFCDVPPMWHVQAIDQRQYSSSSYFMSGISDIGQQIGHGNGRAVPFQGISLKDVNRGFISSRETRQVAVELLRKDTSLSPFNIGRRRDLAVPKKNRSDHRIFNYSNNLDEDFCRNQARINLVSSKAGDANKSLESGKFSKSLKMPYLRPANSEYHEVTMKRHFNSGADKSHSENADAKILRTSEQFSGDIRPSRKISMKPGTKWTVHDKSGDARDNL